MYQGLPRHPRHFAQSLVLGLAVAEDRLALGLPADGPAAVAALGLDRDVAVAVALPGPGEGPEGDPAFRGPESGRLPPVWGREPPQVFSGMFFLFLPRPGLG